MDISKLQIAIKEAERFLLRAHDCLRADMEVRQDAIGTVDAWSDRVQGQQAGTAAVKRASMDLSAALTDLRKFPRRK